MFIFSSPYCIFIRILFCYFVVSKSLQNRQSVAITGYRKSKRDVLALVLRIFANAPRAFGNRECVGDFPAKPYLIACDAPSRLAHAARVCTVQNDRRYCTRTVHIHEASYCCDAGVLVYASATLTRVGVGKIGGLGFID